MTILGISAYYHDSAAALIRDGQVIAAAQEERFTRKKHDASFPANAIRSCLDYAGCSLNDLQAIVFYEKPLLKFERLLETYYAFAPKGLRSFMTSMPVWLREKLFLKRIIWEELGKIGAVDKKKIRLLFPEHHLSHAASAFYPSPYERAAILTIDGVGEWTTVSIGVGEGNKISLLKEITFPHSLGLFYSAITYYCGFKVNSGEYKLMGLAPYGNAQGEQVARYREIIRSQLIDLKPDGSFFLNQEYFSYTTGLRMVDDARWQHLFGFPKRKEDQPLEQCHCDLALAAQQVLEEAVVNLARETRRVTHAEYLCMAGGVALNCVANGKLDALGLFKELFIQPAAGDAGAALGAALAGYYTYFEKQRYCTPGKDSLNGSFLGVEYSDTQVLSALVKYQASFERINDEGQLMDTVAALIAEGKVVGWHQGRMEFGPRALGARSILADARNPEMQKKLNLKIKYREGFRPFAPIVLYEQAGEYFDLQGASPYMLLVKPVKNSRQQDDQISGRPQTLLDKLYAHRSALPAITHVDCSARVQTVHRETNMRLWKLLSSFKAQTGCAVMVNTSFNIRGEPIVNSPEDAYRCFMRTDMDCLVIGNYLLHKKDQLPWNEKGDWKKTIESD